MESVIVGRAEGNNVVIDHVSVSRRHAQLRLGEGTLEVQDLGSANGTFVGAQRLDINKPMAVLEGQPIRFGDVEARFFVPIEAGGTGGAGFDIRGPASTSSDTQATFSVSLTSPPAPVAPGATTTATVVVQNRGGTVDQFTISVVDVPASWVRVSRQQLSLVPAARDEVTIAIQPPRSSEAVARDYTFAVAIVSRETNREVRVLGRFTILPFDGIALVVESRGPRSFWAIASNTGNAPAAYTLAASDEKESLDFSFEQDSVELAPGDRQTVGLRVTPRKRSLFGAIESRPFRVLAKPRGAGTQSATAEGQIVIKPPLRLWRWVAAAVLLVLAVIAGYFIFRNVDFGGGNKQVILPSPTVGSEPSSIVPDTPAVPATGLAKGVKAVVRNSACTNPEALRVRSAAGTASPPITALCDGALVDVLDGPADADGLKWWRIRVISSQAAPGYAAATAGMEGWAAEGSGGKVFLERAP